MTQQLAFTSWGKGELSPQCRGRIDVQHYYSSAERLHNMIVRPYGTAFRRIGTWYVGEVKDSTKDCRLIEFIFSNDQAYIIEMGDKYFRIYNASGTAITTELADINEWADATPYIEGQRVKVTGPSYGIGYPAWIKYYTCLADNTSNTTANKPDTGTDWETYWEEYFAEKTEYDFENATTWATATPYNVDSVVKCVTSTYGGTVERYFVCIAYHVSNTTRDKPALGTSWETYWLEIFEGSGTIGYLESEVAHPYTEEEIWQVDYAQKNDTITFTHPNHDISELRRYNGEVWIFQEGGLVEGPPWEELNQNKNLYLRASAKAIEDVIADGNVLYEALGGDVFKDGDVSIGGDEGRYFRFGAFNDDGEQGYFYVTNVETPRRARGYNVVALISGDKTTRWSRNAFIEGNYPAFVTYHEGRLVLGRTQNDPDRYYFSKTFIYRDFNTADNDEGGFHIGLNSAQANDMKWLASCQNLAVGTFGAEFVTRSPSDGSLRNDNKNAKFQSGYGSEQIRPCKIGNNLYFVQRGGRKLRELYYQWDADRYSADDMTEFADHITTSGIVDMAYQQNQDGLLWCVLTNGDMAVLSRNDKSEIQGWTPIDTQGKVKSIRFLPMETGTSDRGFMIVERYPSTGTKKYIEYFDSHVIEDDTDLWTDLKIYMDSMVEYTAGGGTHVAIGPWHMHAGLTTPHTYHHTDGWPDNGSDSGSCELSFDPVNRKFYVINKDLVHGSELRHVIKADIDDWLVEEDWNYANMFPPWLFEQTGNYFSNTHYRQHLVFTVHASSAAPIVYYLNGETEVLTCLSFENDSFTYDGTTYPITKNVTHSLDLTHGYLNQGDWNTVAIATIDSSLKLWLVLIDSYLYNCMLNIGYIDLTGPTVGEGSYTYTQVVNYDFPNEYLYSAALGNLINGGGKLIVDQEGGKLILNSTYYGNDSHPAGHTFLLVFNSTDGTLLKEFNSDTANYPYSGISMPFLHNNKIYGGVAFYRSAQPTVKGLVRIDLDTYVLSYIPLPIPPFNATTVATVLSGTGVNSECIVVGTNQGLATYNTTTHVWKIINNAEITDLTLGENDDAFSSGIFYDPATYCVTVGLPVRTVASGNPRSDTGQGIVLVDIYDYISGGAASDLSHLEGLTVGVMGDGDYLGSYLVSGGQITGVPTGYSTYYVGLLYDSIVKTNPLNAQTPKGIAKGNVMRINKIGIDVYRSREIEVGRDEATTYPLAVPEGESVNATNHDYTGIVPNVTFDGENDYKGYIVLFQDIPYAMNIFGIYPEVDVKG